MKHGWKSSNHAYAVKKKQQKKENRKKNGLKVNLSGFNDILESIEIKPKSNLQVKQLTVKSSNNKLKSQQYLQIKLDQRKQRRMLKCKKSLNAKSYATWSF
ncbi:unnamed protein product [Mucor hiemalis]